MSNELHINLIPGSMAPRYDEGYEIEVSHCTVTEQGTQENLPIVDFVGRDKRGEKIRFALTGRLVNTLAAAIRGVNLRNHGVEEP